MAVSEAEAAYQKALKGFEENLNSKEMNVVQRPTTLDELCEIAEQISKKHENKEDRKTIRVYEKLNNVRDRIRPFDTLLEALCESAPTGGKFIWGAVRFTFELVEGNHATFLAVLDFFTGIGDKLSIIQTELESFKESAFVVSIGEKIFSVLLDFWTQAIKTYRKMRFRLLDPSSAVLKLKFERLQSDLDDKVALMKDAANAQHHRNFEKLSSGLHKHLRDEHDERIFDWIGAPNYLLDLNKADKKRRDGTCKWILKKDAFLKCISPKKSVNFLTIYGIPGAGKTILSSFIIKHIKNSTSTVQTPGSTPSFVVFHFFKADDDSKNTPITSLRSLLHQVYEFVLDVQIKDIKSLFQSASRKRNVDYDDLWSLFSSIIRSNLLKLTVVLDALDECVKMKSFAKDILALLPCGNLKIFATSRKSGNHVDIIQGSEVEIVQITQKDVSKDIASFVRYKVKKMDNLNSPKLKRLRTLVVDELSKKDNHKGMFLWAYLMCKEIKNQRTVGQIQRLLQELPHDMGAVYIKILSRLNEKPAADQTFVQHVLQWVVGSIRPLTWGELDQALEIDRFRDEYYEDDDEYGETSIYSRRDVVEVCGSLVHYTGLDDGDVLSLIHLSTREFLKGSARQVKGFPKELERYLVNGTDASMTIALRCLNVLNSPSIQSQKHSWQLHRQTTALRDTALENPLFEYSIVYWPEYIDILQANDGESVSSDNIQGLSDLWTMLGQFLSSPFYISWLEGYIQLCGIELASYAVKRLLKLKLSDISPGVNQLIIDTSRSLRLHSNTLEKLSAAVRFCIPTVIDRGKHKPQSPHILPASKDEPEELRPFPPGHRIWMAYDHKSRSLFMAERDSGFEQVVRRRPDGDIAFRPATVREPVWADGAWLVASAALKQDATYLAVTFMPRIPFTRLYKTVCWSVSNSRDATGAAPWARTLFVDETEANIFRVDWSMGMPVDRGALVAFGENNTLICPGGVWDLATAEKLPFPNSIWKEDGPESVSQTCFSTNRAARVRGTHSLEIIELFDGGNHKAGDLVGSYDIALDGQQAEETRIQQFSPQGDKAIVGYEFEPNRMDVCVSHLLFILDSDGIGHTVHLCTGTGISDFRFTSNEQNIVGLYPREIQGQWEISLWSLQRRSGEHEPLVDLMTLWKTSDLSAIAITPPLSTEKMGGVLIALDDGTLVKRSLTQRWTDEEESEFVMSQSTGKTLSRIDSAGNTIYMVSIPETNESAIELVVEAWSIEDKPILRFPILRHDLPAELVTDTQLSKGFTSVPEREGTNNATPLGISADGIFVAVEQNLFRISDKGAASPLRFGTKDIDCRILQFDHSGRRFASLESREGVLTVQVHEIEADEKIRCLASYPIEVPRAEDMWIEFAETQDCALACTFSDSDKGWTGIAKVEDGEVTPVDFSDHFMRRVSFSRCGRYFYPNLHQDTFPPVYRVSSPLHQGEPCLPHDKHPTTMEHGLNYVYASYLYKMHTMDRSGLVFLMTKHVDAPHVDKKYKRIGVIPDLNMSWLDNYLFAVCPQDPTGEVKIVSKPRSKIGYHPTIIKMGITSGDLFDESGWADYDSLLK